MEKQLIKQWVTEAVHRQYADVELTFTFVPVLKEFARVVCRREQELVVVVNYNEFPNASVDTNEGQLALIVAGHITDRILDRLVQAKWHPTGVAQ
ncbi:hypothetical protein [Fibrella aestuarina]|uniref:hypothetical protein n=1 Tax=Fibrella aestuarina TaxID=651143 RepID=UPI0011D23838|nr:hypothetical protein [Fibrella aestuarina]